MCYHSGGPNDSDRTLICVFGYVTSNPDQFLNNEVCKLQWSTADEDTVIVHSYEEVKEPLNNEKEKIGVKKRKLPLRKKSKDDVEMESKKKDDVGMVSKKISTKIKNQDRVELDSKKKK
jgi:hypothetical protein